MSRKRLGQINSWPGPMEKAIEDIPAESKERNGDTKGNDAVFRKVAGLAH